MTSTEEKRKQHCLNAAEAIMKQVDQYTQETQERLKTAFGSGDFDSVVQIAAEIDVRQRRSLAAKITMIRNPKFKPDTAESIHKEIVDGTLNRFSPEEIEIFLKEAEEAEKRQMAEMKPQEDREPPALFKIEGIDELFKSASAAAAAYRKKFGPEPPASGRVKRIHGFKSKPLFVEDTEISEVIANVVPKRGSVTDSVVEPKEDK